jgi:hypothetical protein
MIWFSSIQSFPHRSYLPPSTPAIPGVDGENKSAMIIMPAIVVMIVIMTFEETTAHGADPESG